MLQAYCLRLVSIIYAGLLQVKDGILDLLDGKQSVKHAIQESTERRQKKRQKKHRLSFGSA